MKLFSILSHVCFLLLISSSEIAYSKNSQDSLDGYVCSMIVSEQGKRDDYMFLKKERNFLHGKIGQYYVEFALSGNDCHPTIALHTEKNWTKSKSSTIPAVGESIELDSGDFDRKSSVQIACHRQEEVKCEVMDFGGVLE